MQNSSLKSVGATMMLLALPPADHLLTKEIAANSCLLGDAA
jgi:hypothetical protein